MRTRTSGSPWAPGANSSWLVTPSTAGKPASSAVTILFILIRAAGILLRSSGRSVGNFSTTSFNSGSNWSMKFIAGSPSGVLKRVSTPPHALSFGRRRNSRIFSFEHIGLKRSLRRDAVLIPPAAPVIGQAARFRLTFTVIVGDAIAQWRSRNVNDAAMLRVRLFRLLADIDDACAAISHRLQHPYEIVSVRVDHVGEVEAAAASLGTGDDKQVGEAAVMQAEERFGSLGLPLVLQGTAAAAADPVEGGGAHPLESGRVNQHVERIFDPLMDDAALVDLGDAPWRSVDQMDVRQVERQQVFVVESGPLAAIRVVGLQRRRRLRVLDDRVHPRSNLLHEAEAGIELLLHQLLPGQLTVVFPGFP